VRLDECPSCGGEWLDAGELRGIREEYATDAEREQAAGKVFDEMFGSELAAEQHRTEEFEQKAGAFAHRFRYLCPSTYLPGKQAGGAF